MTDTGERTGAVYLDAQVRTFLIADIRGYTRFTLEQGDEAAARLAGIFADLVEHAVAARDGEVTELRGDEALAVFSSARQALRAAADLQTHLAHAMERDPSLPLNVGIGLDAGEAVPVKGGYRGAALNLAARLCSLAGPGEVLASEGVTLLARKTEGLRYLERGRVSVKGFAEPVGVMQVVPFTAPGDHIEDQAASSTEEGPAHQPLPIGSFLGALPSIPLVGREPELEALIVAADNATCGQGSVVMLSGEPGAGKTRLAQEASVQLRNRSFLLGTGICFEPRQAVPYYPFLDVLSMLYGAATPTVRAQVAERWPYLSALLPEVKIVAPPPIETGHDEQERLFRAATGFVQAIATTTPVALLIDDLHWCDDSSLDLLHHLARHLRGHRVLIVGTYRDAEVGRRHGLERVVRDLHRQGLLERMLVRRLSAEGTMALMEVVVGEQVAHDVAEMVHRQTEGNPYFTHEVVRALIERGDLYRENGHWGRREIEDIEVPESIRSTISERLSHLDDEIQALLREASVLGQTFQFDDLAAMGERTEEEIDDALEQATARGLVGASGKNSYAFDHALTQQTLYAELSPRRRLKLHRTAGTALEQLPGSKREARAAELAWHFLQGDDAERALRYAVQAGDRAVEVFAYPESERHYRTALELTRELEDLGGEMDVLDKLGNVLRITGRYDEAIELLESSATLARRLGDRDREARIVARIAQTHRMHGTPEAGIARLEPLIDELEEQGPPSRLAWLFAELPSLYNMLGRDEDQLAAARRFSELAIGLGDERLRAAAETHRGVSLLALGQVDEGLHVLEVAIRETEAVGDIPNLCIALDFSARVYHGRGQVDRALAHRRQALAISEQVGDPREVSQCALHLGNTSMLAGDWIQARTYFELSLTTALSVDAVQVLAAPLLALGELSLDEGEWEHAEGYLHESTLIAERTGNLTLLQQAAGVLAERDLLQGRTEEALMRLEPLIDRPGWEEPLEFLLSLAVTLVHAGQNARALDVVERAVVLTRSQGTRVGLADALRVRGTVASSLAHWEDAEGDFADALQICRDISYRWGEARVLSAWGECARAQGDAHWARDRLENALANFTHLGARPYAEQAKTALDRLAPIS